MVKYFCLTRGTNGGYAFTFFASEALNLVIVIGQLILFDVFVGGEFFTYGTQVIAQHYMDPQDRSDPMSIIFPRVTKCSFKKYGVSGSIENVDGLCVLPLNVAHEKIFFFFFLYLAIIALITSFHLIYRAMCLMSFFRINQILAKV